ncbi:GntR family transcriptional regulator [Paenibacillus sp. CGMCC 1.18879]|uniref:GntR family transcriptional regulator n=1 Tax=Paenibacillus sp. CGMCC 1.18879 TaxID=2834466 RepID=UPI00223A7E10|nr:GntR family transcriptional regulator [Paenibacillus sp. CGMCC 1.18879]
MNSSVMRTRRLSKDNTYLALKEKIINIELKPGEAVQEENLAELLGVSRTPLREAIQRLENEDFLVRQPNGRLRVASVTTEEVKEIFLIRSMLEGYIAKNAAKNATEQDIEKLTAMIGNLKMSFQSGKSQDFVSYGFEFHDYLSEISELKTFVKILNQLRDHALRYCRFVSLHGDWNQQADEEHNLILQKIAARDEDGAEKAMQDHILSSLSAALERIEGIQATREDGV